MIFILAILIVIVLIVCNIIEPTKKNGGMALMQTENESDSHCMCETHSVMHLLSANPDLYQVAQSNINEKAAKLGKDNLYEDFKKLFIIDENKRHLIASTLRQFFAKDIYNENIKPIVSRIFEKRYQSSTGKSKEYLDAYRKDYPDYTQKPPIFSSLTLYEILSPNIYNYDDDADLIRATKSLRLIQPLTDNLSSNYMMYIERERDINKLEQFTRVALVLDIDFEGFLFSYWVGDRAHIFSFVKTKMGLINVYVLYDDYEGHLMTEYRDKGTAVLSFFRHIFNKRRFYDMIELNIIYDKEKNSDYSLLLDTSLRNQRVEDFVLNTPGTLSIDEITRKYVERFNKMKPLETYNEKKQMYATYTMLHLISTNRDLYRVADININEKVKMRDRDNLYTELQKLFIIDGDKRRLIASVYLNYHPAEIYEEPLEPVVERISEQRIKNLSDNTLLSDYIARDKLYIIPILTLYELLSESPYIPITNKILLEKSPATITIPLADNYIMHIERENELAEQDLLSKLAFILDIDFEMILFSTTQDTVSIVRNNWRDEEYRYVMYNTPKIRLGYIDRDEIIYSYLLKFVISKAYIKKDILFNMELTVVFNKDKNESYETILNRNLAEENSKIKKFIVKQKENRESQFPPVLV